MRENPNKERLSWHTYGNGNPVLNTDPTGLKPASSGGLAGSIGKVIASVLLKKAGSMVKSSSSKSKSSSLIYTSPTRSQLGAPVNNSSYQNMKLSWNGRYALQGIEIMNTYAKANGYIAYSGTRITGIRPHKIGDGSVTVGFGHYIQDEEFSYYFGKYGIRKDMTNAELSNIVMPLRDCTDIFNTDVKNNERPINEFLRGKNITLTQNEFDALVIYRYNKGRLDDQVLDLLETGNRNRDDWEDTMRNLDNGSKFQQPLSVRRQWEVQIFMDGDYTPIQGHFEHLYKFTFE